jgi:alkylhydroperoxidase family enzyme
MMSTPYDSNLAMRPELVAAQSTALSHWASPGSFWTGAQRLAVVAEVRRARDADALPPWVAPTTVDGLVPTDPPLPATAIDVVWRLTNHPGTLTAAWYDSIADAGLEPGPYVELVAIVAQANCVDRFTDALDLPRLTLPEPVPGDPSGHVAENAQVRAHWVPTAEITGANVQGALSLLPDENAMREMLSGTHYLPAEALLGDLVSDHGSLSRIQIEVVASRTSKLNECFY